MRTSFCAEAASRRPARSVKSRAMMRIVDAAVQCNEARAAWAQPGKGCDVTGLYCAVLLRYWYSYALWYPYACQDTDGTGCNIQGKLNCVTLVLQNVLLHTQRHTPPLRPLHTSSLRSLLVSKVHFLHHELPNYRMYCLSKHALQQWSCQTTVLRVPTCQVHMPMCVNADTANCPLMTCAQGVTYVFI